MTKNISPKNVTFVVTEECNFRCKYCYLVAKNNSNRMPRSVAFSAIDYLLGHRDLFPENDVVWEFIGGEPFLEINLIEDIIEYIHLEAYRLSHPWFENSRYNLTTNGSLYNTAPVQEFILRHRERLGVTVSIDGPKHAHDAMRVFADGSGTYSIVAANIPVWLSQFPGASTKMTVGHENLPFLAESVLHVFSLGIKEVHANVVFEKVWEDGDDLILERQLDILGKSIIEKGLYLSHNCSFFRRGIGQPLSYHDNTNWCGSGKMLAIDGAGNFYPCNRFLPFSLVNRDARTVGNIRDGLDINRVRPFISLTRTSQSPRECIECEVARGCAWCQGFNYDDADTPTIFQRATHLCPMHKARVRANNRFWERVDSLCDRKLT